MNKPKYQLTNRARKKMNKEVRASKTQLEPQLKSDNIKPANLLSRYPKKTQKKEKASLKSLAKNLTAKEHKKKSHRSKRTGPGTRGTDEREGTPKFVHIEGKRWIQNTESKIQASKKVSRRQNLKKKGR